MNEALALEEYRSLRAVIGSRGSLRVVVFAAAFVAWALGALLVASLLVQPLAAIVPLLVLVAGFEAVHALHVGVERIGRYLYVRYESGGTGPAWESTIAAFGRGPMSAAGRPSGAHFAMVFAFAVAANLLVLTLGALPGEFAALSVLHGVVIVRIFAAVRAAGRQRTQDEARFREITSGGPQGR